MCAVSCLGAARGVAVLLQSVPIQFQKKTSRCQLNFPFLKIFYSDSKLCSILDLTKLPYQCTLKLGTHYPLPPTLHVEVVEQRQSHRGNILIVTALSLSNIRTHARTNARTRRRCESLCSRQPFILRSRRTANVVKTMKMCSSTQMEAKRWAVKRLGAAISPCSLSLIFKLMMMGTCRGKTPKTHHLVNLSLVCWRELASPREERPEDRGKHLEPRSATDGVS